jgi:hypothetical protein
MVSVVTYVFFIEGCLDETDEAFIGNAPEKERLGTQSNSRRQPTPEKLNGHFPGFRVSDYERADDA